ncbi:MAG: peptidoglycan DD-metalloendopeptidase family protein [Alcanivorax sp.]
MYVKRGFLKKLALHRIIKVRHRYFLTRNNRLRLRYVAGTVMMVSVSMFSLLGAMNSSVAFVPNASDLIAYNSKKTPSNFDASLIALPAQSEYNMGGNDITSEQEKADEKLSMFVEPFNSDVQEFTPDIKDAKPEELALVEQTYGPLQPPEEILKIRPGDTIAGALQGVGVSGAEAYRAVKAISKYYDPRMVKPGQAISIRVDPADEGVILSSLTMKVDSVKELVVTKDPHDRFQSEVLEKEVILKMKAAKASINSSLYASAARAGIPASVIAEMIRLYSYEVDFQRDIRQGDTVEILYETYETDDGDFARYGNVLFANLKVNGTKIPIYRYEEDNGRAEYFREDGMNLRNTLMKTPIDGARMSSGFGMRRHPVLGYNRMHKGVDFAAPRGTPIYAAGDGVIDKIGRNGGYGNYIRIRHVNSLKTAYAHMHKFAKGMSKGKRVKQGDVIGYVGTTGRSTGPHLHYEVLKSGKQVNPKSIKTSNRQKLAGSELEKFRAQMKVIQQKYATLAEHLKFAQNDLSE